MQTQHIRYFVDTIQLGSMAKAAKKHYITTQGVSKALASLEKSIGFKLIDYSNADGITLTPYGKAFITYAKNAVAREDEMISTLISISNKLDTKSDRVVKGYCCEAVFDTKALYPLIDHPDNPLSRFCMYIVENEEILDRLIAVQEDDSNASDHFGIISIFEAKPFAAQKIKEEINHSNYEYRPFLSYFDEILVNESSALASKDLLDLSDIADAKLVALPTSYADSSVEDLIGEQSAKVVCSDMAFRMRLVRENDAITLIPGIHMLQNNLEGLVAKPMKNPFRVEFGFVAGRQAFEAGPVADIFKLLVSFYKNINQ